MNKEDLVTNVDTDAINEMKKNKIKKRLEEFECQECGMKVISVEFHDYECCKRYKLALKLARLNQFEIEVSKKCQR